MLACAAILIVLTTHTVMLKQVKTLLPFHPIWGFLYGAIHYVPSDLRYDVIVVRFVYLSRDNRNRMPYVRTSVLYYTTKPVL